jgi:glucan phosphoethanolaminetransferase (alkaline phosphatase superfamily)
LTKVILMVALICAGLLLLVTALLVYLNWSPKVWAPLLSAFAVGLVTVIIAIFANLKDTDIQRDFASSVVINDQTRLAVLYVPTGPATTAESRLMNLSRLAQPIVQKNGKPVEQFKGPANDGEIFTYYGELLQYYLLKELGEIQRRQ